MKAAVTNGLNKEINTTLVREAIRFFEELKNSYALGDYEKTILKGGKFIEVIARVIQFRINEPITPKGSQVEINKLTKTAENSLKTKNPDSIRLLIPRILRPLYDIRNNRGAHFSPINPNSIDAAIMEMGCSWIMSELIRLFITDNINETKKLLLSLISKRVPLVEEWEQFLTVLNPKTSVPDQILLLLYKKHPDSVSVDDLKTWVKTKDQKNVTRSLRRLIERRHILCITAYKISASGRNYIEKKFREDIFH